MDRVCGVSVAVRLDGGRTLVACCHVADGATARTIGLLATRDLRSDEGVWLERCGSIHTIGMRTPIACAFLGDDGRVLRIIDPLPPWRTARARGARSVIEASVGTFAGIDVGARLIRSARADLP